MSNRGAMLLNQSFINDNAIQKTLDEIALFSEEWKNLQPTGLYANTRWKEIQLIADGKPTANLDSFAEMKKVIEFFKCPIRVMSFYSLLPGAKLHRHRDLTGTLELKGLRFHIPLITHPDITFHSAGEDLHMKKGELWAVNTSYLHAVHNPTTDVNRIHIMLEVDVNEWVWSLLPKKDVHYYVHTVFFYIFIGLTVFKTLFEPRKLHGRLILFKNTIRNQLRKRRISSNSQSPTFLKEG